MAAESRLEALERKVTWSAVERPCLTLLPLAAVLIAIGGLGRRGGRVRGRSVVLAKQLGEDFRHW